MNQGSPRKKITKDPRKKESKMSTRKNKTKSASQEPVENELVRQSLRKKESIKASMRKKVSENQPDVKASSKEKDTKITSKEKESKITSKEKDAKVVSKKREVTSIRKEKKDSKGDERDKEAISGSKEACEGGGGGASSKKKQGLPKDVRQSLKQKVSKTSKVEGGLQKNDAECPGGARKRSKKASKPKVEKRGSTEKIVEDHGNLMEGSIKTDKKTQSEKENNTDQRRDNNAIELVKPLVRESNRFQGKLQKVDSSASDYTTIGDEMAKEVEKDDDWKVFHVARELPDSHQTTGKDSQTKQQPIADKNVEQDRVDKDNDEMHTAVHDSKRDD